MPSVVKSYVRSHIPTSHKTLPTPIFRVQLPRVPLITRASTLPRPKPSTMSRSPKLSTTIRAKERNKSNIQLKEKENELRIQKQKLEEVNNKEAAEKTEILRKNLVHNTLLKVAAMNINV